MSEIERSPKGTFLPGKSGNPAGRPVGVRNQTTQVKEFIEHALANDLKDDALDIMAVAVRKAKSGDNAMIKLLLGDFLNEVRKDSGEPVDSAVTVNVNNMTDGPVGVVIELGDT